MAFFTSVLLISIGLTTLIWGAGAIVQVTPSLAKTIGISPLAAGAIILGIGTSLPELAVSVAAGIANESLIAYGNAVGSNIANVGLILSIAALITTITFIGEAVRWQFILMTLATLLFLFLAMDTQLTFNEGLLLILFLMVSLWVIVRGKGLWQQNHPAIKRSKQAFNLVAGFGCIFVGAPLTVRGVSMLALNLGVPPQLVSLSLLALGTSLPELVVTIRAAIHREPQLVIGNVLGSNIFNLLLVVAVACLFSPIYLNISDLQRDGSFLILTTLLLLVLCFSWNRQRKLSRLGGGLLLSIYCLYIGAIVISGL